MTSPRSIERRLDELAPAGEYPKLSLAVFLSTEEWAVVHDDPKIVECDGERYRSAGLLEQLAKQMADSDDSEDSDS